MQQPVVIYDGECPMCLRARDWIAAHSAPGAIAFLPCQDARRAEIAPQVSLETCMQAMQLVMPDGTVYAGAEAFPPLLRAIPRYRWLARLLEAPGVRHLSPVVYGRIAKHRLALSGLFKKREAGESCRIDTGCK